MASSFSMTLRIAAFRSCLTVASCTTIPVRIRRAPATTSDESVFDKK
jgi:starvation-inducible outer membrane lipoprotein